MEPEIRHLIVCDNARVDSSNYHRINVFGLTTTVRSTAVPAFPVVRPCICVLLIVTGGQESGVLRVRIVHQVSKRLVFQSLPRSVRFVGDPEAVLGMLFRIRDCSFPMAGLYWVEVVFGATVIGRQKLWLKT
jgi:hypothetical protein